MSTITPITVHVGDSLSLDLSCNCGQAFRWNKTDDGSFSCVIGKSIVNAKISDGDLTVYSLNGAVDEKFVRDYFDIDRDYSLIENMMSNDSKLKPCIPYGHGIRIFAQEPFETLISFIISANNNIKRITGIINNMCMRYGERIDSTDMAYYSFPTPESLANLNESDLTAIGAGYRAPYIIKTARAICDGFDLDTLRKTDYSSAKKKLCELSGVGPKVADCILLFSLGHTEAFPMDTWIKKAMSVMFFDGKTPTSKEVSAVIEALGESAGIIQQYIFHYARQTSLKVG